MGLFSKLRGQAPTLNKNDAVAKAVIAMPLLVAASDGKIDDAEKHQICNLCTFSPIFHAVGVERTMALIGEVLSELRAHGGEHVFAAAMANLSPRLRETAMCFALRAALADGYLAPEEKDMLAAMGGRMGISQETFEKLFEVLAILQLPGHV